MITIDLYIAQKLRNISSSKPFIVLTSHDKHSFSKDIFPVFLSFLTFLNSPSAGWIFISPLSKQQTFPHLWMSGHHMPTSHLINILFPQNISVYPISSKYYAQTPIPQSRWSAQMHYFFHLKLSVCIHSAVTDLCDIHKMR